MKQARVITLMFHRVNDVTLGYRPEVFEQYLQYLVQNFPIVVPGEPLPQSGIAICLTFDDAYYDFYHNVFPLLKKHQVKALLAVPVKYIVDETKIPDETRLQVPYVQGMEDPNYAPKIPFCTWNELREMSQSGLVEIASHSLSHANLSKNSTDLSEEIIVSQKILQDKLNIPIKNFVYPYGCFSKKAHQIVRKHYDFGIRIGSALNVGWDQSRHFVYRINADPLWTTQKPINSSLINKLTLKYWINRVRLK